MHGARRVQPRHIAKKQHGRTIRMHRELRAALAALRVGDRPSPSAPVVLARHGDRISANALAKYLGRPYRKAGLWAASSIAGAAVSSASSPATPTTTGARCAICDRSALRGSTHIDRLIGHITTRAPFGLCGARAGRPGIGAAGRAGDDLLREQLHSPRGFRHLAGPGQGPCANGTTEVDFTTRMNQQAEPPPGGGLDPNIEAGLVVGGAAVIATCVFWWWCQHGDRPASP